MVEESLSTEFGVISRKSEENVQRLIPDCTTLKAVIVQRLIPDCTTLKAVIAIAKPNEPLNISCSDGAQGFSVWKDSKMLGIIDSNDLNESVWKSYGFKLKGNCTLFIPDPMSVRELSFVTRVPRVTRGGYAPGITYQVAIENEEFSLRASLFCSNFNRFTINGALLNGLQQSRCDLEGGYESEDYSVNKTSFNCNLNLRNISAYENNAIACAESNDSGRSCTRNLFFIHQNVSGIDEVGWEKIREAMDVSGNGSSELPEDRFPYQEKKWFILLALILMAVFITVLISLVGACKGYKLRTKKVYENTIVSQELGLIKHDKNDKIDATNVTIENAT